MLLILLTWLILLVFFIPSGVVVKSILKIETSGLCIPIFFGLFLQSLILICSSFFIKIGLLVFVINFITQIFFFLWKHEEIKVSILDSIIDILSLSKISKIILLSILFFSLLKCAQFPFIIDNEIYYLQTIKWINEYGLVKGLGNLHIFLAQSSPFHILQAAFNFNFLTGRINDLNGFILLVSSFFFINEFEKKYSSKGEIHWIGLIIVFNILFFQFINAPSPDLSIVLLSQIIFYFYLENQNNLSNYLTILILFLFLFFIKITIAPIGLLLLFLLAKDKNRILYFVVFSSVVTTILILKNYILTGYLIYPFKYIVIDVDWLIPEKMLDLYTTSTRNAGYFKNNSLTNPSLHDKLFSWITLGGINRIFNFGIIVLFILALFIKKIRFEIKYKILYFVLFAHFIILLFTLSQFRFFLPEFIFLFALVMSSILNYFKVGIKQTKYILLTSILLPIIVVINFIDYEIFTQNKLHQKEENYKWIQLLIPENNSRYSNLKFKKIKDGNIEYYSPQKSDFFWITGNGNLPCVNKEQIDFFKKKYFILPQQRTSNIKDGFYAKEIENE